MPKVGSYRLTDKLNSTPSCSVYLGRHAETGVRYAVKTFEKKQIEDNPILRERVRREIYVMKRISADMSSGEETCDFSPQSSSSGADVAAVVYGNISAGAAAVVGGDGRHVLGAALPLDRCYVVTLREVLQTPRAVYLVMDLAGGGSLADLVKKDGSLQERMVMGYFYQMMRGVSFLHNSHVVHRDIKAENIFLSSDGAYLKIGDFGLSVLVDDADFRNAPPPGVCGRCRHCGQPVNISPSPSPSILVQGQTGNQGGVGGGGSSSNNNNSRSVWSPSTEESLMMDSADTATRVLHHVMTCPYCGVPQRCQALIESVSGTPGYIAPEVLRPDPKMCGALPRENSAGVNTSGYDGYPADIWSCGVVLYFMLTAKLPFDPTVTMTRNSNNNASSGSLEGDSGGSPSLLSVEGLHEMYRRIVSGEYTIPPYVSAGARALLQRLLCIDPAARPSAEEVLHDPWLVKGNHV